MKIILIMHLKTYGIVKHLFLLSLLVLSTGLAANNVQVTNVSLTGQNTDDNYTLVAFDISWENSWRLSSGPANYDGAWIFVKYRINGGIWQHGHLNYVDGTPAADGHTVAPGSTFRTTADGVGGFVYRDTDGSGDVNFAGMQLRWNYGFDGVSDGAIVDVQVYAIEMVYIPQGSYQLGSTTSGGEVDNFYTNTGVFGFQATYNVTSEAAIPVSSAVGDLYYAVTSGENQGDQMGPIPAAFPKGYMAFWMMKYEVTEDQWVCFFNSLTETQKLNHDITDIDHKNTDLVAVRNTIAYTAGNATTSAPSRACAYLSYEDNAAYYDWTGLRFATELEFEKAAKGPVHTLNMLASGGVIASNQLFTIVNDGQETALITNPGLNITNMNYSVVDPGGPVRVGIFAASAINPSRVETGGSYYGVMELSANLYERLIGVGTPTNRAYQGTHGDGELLSSGYHNVSSWPTTGSQGAISYRGGSYANSVGICTVADRTSAAVLSSITNSRIGMRGVRTAN